jgi:hypothetical protein
MNKQTEAFLKRMHKSAKDLAVNVVKKTPIFGAVTTTLGDNGTQSQVMKYVAKNADELMAIVQSPDHEDFLGELVAQLEREYGSLSEVPAETFFQSFMFRLRQANPTRESYSPHDTIIRT